MRNILAMIAAAAALVAGSVQAATSVTYFEQTIGFAFVDGGVPGRSVGDSLIFQALLIDTASGAVVANKSATCNTIEQNASNGHFISWCNETINFSNGQLRTAGRFDEINYETYGVEPERLQILSGTGAYTGKVGFELLKQIRFPDQAAVTFVFMN